MFVYTIDIKSLQNRLLKVCYVPASSAPIFQSYLLAAAIKQYLQSKQGRRYIPLSSQYYLDVYGVYYECYVYMDSCFVPNKIAAGTKIGQLFQTCKCTLKSWMYYN
jgi:hypothetical protein